MAPYQFKKENGVVTSDGIERPPNAAERERLHGFSPGHTAIHPEGRRISLIGNSFHCVAVAHMLASWALKMDYLREVPTIKELWRQAGFFGIRNRAPVYYETWRETVYSLEPVINRTEDRSEALEQFQLEEVLRLSALENQGTTKCAGTCIVPNCGAPCQKLPGHQRWCSCSGNSREGAACADSCATAVYPCYDPGVHTSGLGDDRITVVSQPEPEPENAVTAQDKARWRTRLPRTSPGKRERRPKRRPPKSEEYLGLDLGSDSVCHLVQDEETIAELHQLGFLRTNITTSSIFSGLNGGRTQIRSCWNT